MDERAQSFLTPPDKDFDEKEYMRERKLRSFLIKLLGFGREGIDEEGLFSLGEEHDVSRDEILMLIANGRIIKTSDGKFMNEHFEREDEYLKRQNTSKTELRVMLPTDVFKRIEGEAFRARQSIAEVIEILSKNLPQPSGQGESEG